MQIIFKIGEFKPKTKADLTNVFKYITRESAVYKAKGIGVSSNPNIAVRQFMINKRKHKKAEDNKNRFAYHEILSFEAGTDPELAYKIAEDYCKNLHYKKGFNCYFAIQTDTDNVHAHILVDSVNFKTGNMLISENEKELEKRPELKNKIEFYSLEQQMKFAEDMAIKNGYIIEDEKRYEYMHEAKKHDKNARKWLTKNQYKVFKQDEEKSWRNEIANKIKEMYKRIDITEDNIKEIAKEYNLEVTRHNKKNKTITFAILDQDGKATKQRLKLVEALSEKSGKNKLKEEDKDKVKLGVKLERLHDQEKGNFTSETNPFDYNNFFRDRTKELENNREFEEFIKEIEAEELEKELEKVMKEKEKTIKEVADNLIKNKENIYIKEQEKAVEINKMIEINQKDYKQDEKKITNLEKELIERKEEIPTLEENIKTYTNNKTILEEKLPSKEIEAEKKIDIADEKAKEVERLKALLQKAENEFYFANKEKEEAISDRDNTKERIENIDSLIKNNESKIVENKEKITIIPREVETLKEGLEEKKNVIAFRQEQLEKVFNNVKEKEQDYKNTKENALEKVLEYESYIKSLYEKKIEAEEEKKLEVAERYRKEIEEYQQNLIKQNIEWDRINKLNREIAEQVRLEREQKALAKKKLEAEARAKIELEEKIKTDLQNFINLIDKGKITNEDLIEMVDDLDECENWKDSHKLQYGKNIKFYLSDLENTIKVKSFFREANEVNKIIYTNEKLFERISKYMDNIDKEKAIPNAKGVDKTVKEVEKVKKEEKEFE